MANEPRVSYPCDFLIALYSIKCQFLLISIVKLILKEKFEYSYETKGP